MNAITEAAEICIEKTYVQVVATLVMSIGIFVLFNPSLDRISNSIKVTGLLKRFNPNGRSSHKSV